MKVVIRKSSKRNKKFAADVHGRTIHFGDSRYEDFTQHNDPERKKRYIQRHKKNENWSDVQTAGFYAKHLLWNKPTLKKSIDDLNSRFKTISFELK